MSSLDQPLPTSSDDAARLPRGGRDARVERWCARFAPAGALTEAEHWALSQRLWRLARWAGLEGLESAALVPGPLAPAAAASQLATAIAQLASAHQARVAGLRFWTAPGGWGGPRLVPGTDDGEQARREDVLALAAATRALVGLPEAPGPADAALSSAAPELAGALSALESGLEPAWTALTEAAERLGAPVALPARLSEVQRSRLYQAEAERVVERLEGCGLEGRLEVVEVEDPRGSAWGEWLEALERQVATLGGWVVAARCEGPTSPLAPWRAVAGALLAARGIAAATGLPEAWRALAALWPDSTASGLAALPPRLAKVRLFQALSGLLAEMASQRPLVVVLREADQADAMSRAFGQHLEAHAEGLPLLVVRLVRRSDGASPLVRLGPMAPEAIASQVQALCGVPVSKSALEAAHIATEGDPALLRRLVTRWLRTGQLKRGDDGFWAPAAAMPETPPAGLVRELLRAIALLGGETDLATLGGVMDAAPEALWEALDAALDAGWLYQAGVRIGFRLPEELTGCLAALPDEEQSRWRQQLAARLPHGPAAAFQALAAGAPDASERALASAREALALGALTEAERWLEAGEACLGDSSGLAGAYALTGALAAIESGAPGRAVARIVPVLERPELPGPERAALLHGLGQARRALGEPEAALAALAAALEGLEAEGGPPRARLLLDLAHVRLDLGQVKVGQAYADEALAIARQGQDAVLLVEAHLAVGRALLLGGPEALSEGLAHLESVFEQAFVIGHLDAARLAYHWLGHVQMSLSQVGDAYASFAQHRELVSLLGAPRDQAAAAVDLAWAALQIGYFEQALAEVELVESLLAESRWPGLWGQALTIRAVALLVLGYLHDPLRLLDQALRLANGIDDPILELVVLGHLVYALLFLGKYGRAAEVCERALRRAVALDDTGETLRLRLLQAEIAWRQGDLVGAEESLVAVKSRSEAEALELARAAAALGLARLALERDALEQATLLGEEALAAAQLTGCLWLQGEIHGCLGDAARRQGQREAAAGHFDAALSTADLIGSPHHRALALQGLSQVAESPAQSHSLRARAAENLQVYLEQLAAAGREDFLRWPERRRVLEIAAPEPASERPRPEPRPSAPPAAIDEGDFLASLRALLAAKGTLDELLERLCGLMLKLSHASRALVYLASEDGELRLRHRKDAHDRLSVLGLDEGCRWAIQRVEATRQTLVSADASRDAAMADWPEVQQQSLRGLLCVPVTVARPDGDRLIGCLYGDAQAPWGEDMREVVRQLELVAGYSGVLLELGMLQDESNRRAHRLAMLNQLSRALAGTLDLDRLLTLALGQIMQITQGEEGYVFFGEGLACRASQDRAGQTLTDVHVSRSVIARVTRDRQPVAILDIGQDQELQARASIMVHNVRSVMCVPLLLDDRLVGLIYISSSTANKTFSRHDLDLMTAISAQVALALQNAQAYETIKELNVGLEEKVRARTAELSAAYRELQDAQVQLVEKEKLATIGTLAAGVAHEINNPLGAILTNAQLLKLDLDDPEHVESLDLIEAGARRCKDIVSALLRYSKEDRASHVGLDLRALIEAALAHHAPALREAQVQLETQLAPVPGVLGDPAELGQVLSHLIANALDAIRARHGGGGGRLLVRLGREPAGAVIVFEDNGQGMSAGVQRRIFDPFFTTKRVGAGQGLGLSVCQRIVEQHGGKLQVRSAEGQGATFTITLPVV